jgi:serine/threonine-protein kinase
MGLILYEPIPVPTARNPDLPPALDEWWQRAACRDREKRFQSAKELADELAKALALEAFVTVPTAARRRPTSSPGAARASGIFTPVRDRAPSDPTVGRASQPSDSSLPEPAPAAAEEQERGDSVEPQRPDAQRPLTWDWQSLVEVTRRAGLELEHRATRALPWLRTRALPWLRTRALPWLRTRALPWLRTRTGLAVGGAVLVVLVGLVLILALGGSEAPATPTPKRPASESRPAATVVIVPDPEPVSNPASSVLSVESLPLEALDDKEAPERKHRQDDTVRTKPGRRLQTPRRRDPQPRPSAPTPSDTRDYGI